MAGSAPVDGLAERKSFDGCAVFTGAASGISARTCGAGDVCWRLDAGKLPIARQGGGSGQDAAQLNLGLRLAGVTRVMHNVDKNQAMEARPPRSG